MGAEPQPVASIVHGAASPRPLVVKNPAPDRHGLALARFVEDPSQVVFQYCELRFDDGPHFVNPNTIIGVDQNISETGDPAPRNIRVALAQIVGDLLRGFTDDLEVADHGILNHR